MWSLGQCCTWRVTAMTTKSDQKTCTSSKWVKNLNIKSRVQKKYFFVLMFFYTWTHIFKLIFISAHSIDWRGCRRGEFDFVPRGYSGASSDQLLAFKFCGRSWCARQWRCPGAGLQAENVPAEIPQSAPILPGGASLHVHQAFCQPQPGTEFVFLSQGAFFCTSSFFQVYVPLYLHDSLKESAEALATVPLAMFLSSFAMSFLVGHLNKFGGRKVGLKHIFL